MATSGVGVRELPEAHTFDFITCVCVCLSAQAQGPFVTLEQNGLWLSL